MKKIGLKSKVLCVCEGGNVRSVALAFLFKMNGVDAVACGAKWSKPDTVEMLSKWATHILIAEGWMKEHIPKRFHKKVVDMEIGPDRWGLAHKELLDLCHSKMVDKLKL